MGKEEISQNQQVADGLLRKQLENSTDIAESAKLFSIYQKLISPVAEFEKIEDNLEIINPMIKEKEVPENAAFGTLARGALFSLIAFLIYTIILIVVFLKLNDMGALSGVTPEMEDKAGVIGMPLLITVSVITGLFIGFMRSKKAERNRVEELESNKSLKADLERRRAELLREITPMIKYCPPAYRNSDALTFFVESYRNSRVSTLKEAVREYDALNRHEEICSALSNIENKINNLDVTVEVYNY